MKITLDTTEREISFEGDFTLDDMVEELFILKDSYIDILDWKVVPVLGYTYTIT